MKSHKELHTIPLHIVNHCTKVNKIHLNQQKHFKVFQKKGNLNNNLLCCDSFRKLYFMEGAEHMEKRTTTTRKQK